MLEKIVINNRSVSTYISTSLESLTKMHFYIKRELILNDAIFQINSDKLKKGMISGKSQEIMTINL